MATSNGASSFLILAPSWVLMFVVAAAGRAQEATFALSSRVQAAVIQSALKELETRAAGARTQLVPLRVVLAESDKPPDPGAPGRVGLVTVIDYASAASWMVSVAPDTLRVLEVRGLSGRPQSSPEERARAEAIAKRDSQVARLLDAKAYLIGGFVVDAPDGAPRVGRYLEYHVGSADHRTIVLELIIDVASEKIVGKRESGP